MSLPQEMVMAYVDGELDDATRARVEAAMKADPAVHAQVQAQMVLRQRLHAHFDQALTEPVPDRLVQALREPSHTGVSDLALARAAKQAKAAPTRNWSVRHFGAIAASLVLGVVIGQGVFFRASQESVQTQTGTLVAGGALSTALSTQLAGTQSDGAPVQIGLTYKNDAGEFCRTFALRETRTSAGIACRSGAAWRIEMLEQLSPAASATYRTAGTELPASVRQAVENHIAGEPLDSNAESAARDAGWR